MGISNIKFSGIASGMDTESIVKAMIAPQQHKVDTAHQNKLLMELKKDAWKEMNTKIYDFYKDTLGTLKFNSSYGNSDVTSSNPNVIKVDKDGKMPAGNHTIKVDKVATGATVSTEKIIRVSEPTKGTTLKDLGFDENDIITVNVNGVEKKLEVKFAKDAIIGTDDEVLEAAVEATTIGDVEAFLAQGKDGKVDPNISAKFDNTLGAFIISSKNTGEKQSISFSVNGGTENEKLKNLGFAATGGVYEYFGQDAEFTYNGQFKQKSASNNIDINGLKATIVGVSEEEISISSVKNIQSTVDFVKDFVTQYNALIDEMNTLVDAPRNTDYKPLTSAQKESMTESDIKLWEKKVNDSILRGDPTLKDLTRDMRTIIGNSDLFSIGIGTSKDWTEKGKLHIDEEKLTKMLGEDPTRIDQILKGVGTKLYDKVSEKLVKGTTLKSANNLFNDKWIKEQISASDQKVLDLEKRLAMQETMHYKKFTAMEKMLGQLNQQGSWLSSQLGGN